MQTCYSTTKERLRATARTIARIELRREMEDDPTIGRAVEAFLINRELRELEQFALQTEG